MLFMVISGLCLTQFPVHASEKAPEVLSYQSGQTLAPAHLAQFAWMVGDWRWEGDVYGYKKGSLHIFPEKGQQMIALARGFEGDKFWMSEVVNYIEENGSVVKRMRHLGFELNSWEPQNEPIVVRLLRVEENIFYFHDHTIVKHNDNHYTLYLGLYNEKGEKYVVPIEHHRIK